MTDQIAARFAATVVLLRDRPTGGALEVLMIHRPTIASMFPDAWVFPGGTVDVSGEIGVSGARAAAVREAQEEVGLTTDEDALVPIALWEPPGHGRRFNTTFFATDAFWGEVKINVDEADDFAWAAPADFLQRHGDGGLSLAVPTWMTLHRLSEFASAKAALRSARSLGDSSCCALTYMRSRAGDSSSGVAMPAMPREILTRPVADTGSSFRNLVAGRSSDSANSLLGFIEAVATLASTKSYD